jgi:hypothetical protein
MTTRNHGSHEAHEGEAFVRFAGSVVPLGGA